MIDLAMLAIAAGKEGLVQHADAAADSVTNGVSEFLGYEVKLGTFTIGVGGVIAAILVLLGIWLLTKLLQRGFVRYAQKREVNTRAAIYTVSRIAKYLVIAIGLMIALSLIGIPISKFAVIAGAVGVGLGFGLQAIFSNFVSGLILLFDRSLKVGDFVELASGVHGEVSDINIRATRITTNDNIEILVPNSEFVTGRVVNWTHNEALRRTHIPFGVPNGTDKELVKKAALEAAAEVPFTLSNDGPRGPKVWLVGFGDNSLNFELVIWLTAEATKRPSSVKAAYNWALETALKKYGIELPFPQRDLHVRSLFGMEGEAAQDLLHDRHPHLHRKTAAAVIVDEAFANNDAADDVISPIKPIPPPVRDDGAPPEA